MKYNIFTKINGVKNYVRRVRHGKYVTTVTMLSGKEKAKDFGTKEKVTATLNRMGIGYAIEENKK